VDFLPTGVAECNKGAQWQAPLHAGPNEKKHTSNVRGIVTCRISSCPAHDRAAKAGWSVFGPRGGGETGFVRCNHSISRSGSNRKRMFQVNFVHGTPLLSSGSEADF
jgi:hypothetical protein